MPGIDAVTDILAAVRDRAAASARFASVAIEGERLRCRAKGAEAEAWYVVDRDGGRWSVALLTPDRWLSESIESDLMHFGDPLEELVEEELAELGWRGRVPQIKHFRDDAKLYTFENALPDGVAGDALLAAKFLFAYEAAFRSLGDVGGGDDDE